MSCLLLMHNAPVFEDAGSPQPFAGSGIAHPAMDDDDDDFAVLQDDPIRKRLRFLSDERAHVAPFVSQNMRLRFPSKIARERFVKCCADIGCITSQSVPFTTGMQVLYTEERLGKIEKWMSGQPFELVSTQLALLVSPR